MSDNHKGGSKMMSRKVREETGNKYQKTRKNISKEGMFKSGLFRASKEEEANTCYHTYTN